MRTEGHRVAVDGQLQRAPPVLRRVARRTKAVPDRRARPDRGASPWRRGGPAARAAGCGPVCWRRWGGGPRPLREWITRASLRRMWGVATSAIEQLQRCRAGESPARRAMVPLRPPPVTTGHPQATQVRGHVPHRPRKGH
jgi:hypothetical protein